MNDEEYIFILGAGASIPHGFPSGAELKKRILINVSNAANSDYRRAGFSENEVREFNDAFGRSQVDSIDFFLSNKGNEKFAEIGKFAIAYEIMARESHSELFGSQDHDAGAHYLTEDRIAFHEGWYRHLWNAMEKSEEKFSANSRFKFITFNYDRSLEEFLALAFVSMNSTKNFTNENLSKILSSVEIIHVHGKIGDLEWQTSNAINRKPYGKSARVDAMKALSSQIRIIGESNDTDVEFVRARTLIEKNHNATILFLGFGFHDENLRRLGMAFGEAGTSILFQRKVNYTNYGLSSRKRQLIASLTNQHARVGNVTCREVIEQYF